MGFYSLTRLRFSIILIHYIRSWLMFARIFVWLIYYLYLWLHVDLSCLREFYNSTYWFKLVLICRYICDKFGHAQICMNDCFIPNSFSEKEDYFRIYFLSSKDNWWGRAPMVSMLSWWVLRSFNLLRHIYIGFTNMYLCERLSYNPFNRTYVIFTIVFLTLYDLTPYYTVLPLSISSLVFRIWSICFRCIIFF